MKWTTEVPKESGWYWVKIESEYVDAEVIELIDDMVWAVGRAEFLDVEEVSFWGDKLEIPE